MRIAMALALGLAGCASSGDVYRPPAELVAQYDARMGGPPPSMSAAAQERAERDRQARTICEARGRLREQSLPWRGVLNLENVVAGQQAAQICMDAYLQTGMVPSL